MTNIRLFLVAAIILVVLVLTILMAYELVGGMRQVVVRIPLP